MFTAFELSELTACELPLVCMTEEMSSCIERCLAKCWDLPGDPPPTVMVDSKNPENVFVLFYSKGRSRTAPECGVVSVCDSRGKRHSAYLVEYVYIDGKYSHTRTDCLQVPSQKRIAAHAK